MSNGMHEKKMVRLSLLLGILSLPYARGGNAAIQPNPFLKETSCNHGEVVDDEISPLSCNIYRISTLNSNPHRCLHVTVSDDDTEQAPTACFDSPDWSDGTNGCSAYRNNEGWCETFGSSPEQSSAKMACCVCGGGERRPTRFKVGDFVKAPKQSQKCTLKVVAIQETMDSTYTLEFVDNCVQRTSRMQRTMRAGQKVKILFNEDDRKQNDIQEWHRYLLRKCRPGAKEQEFWVIPQELQDGTDQNKANKFQIKHLLTNRTINGISDPVELQYVFVEEETKFSGGDKFVYIRHGSNYLSGGEFGKNDYSEVEWINDNALSAPIDSPQTMWRLDQVEKRDYYHTDQHIKWLKDKVIDGNIDNLKQLTPWHLLDIERDASKQEVKARFRMLSKEFHPDKKGGALFEQVFILLQQGYDGLKKANEKERERFRVDAEVEAQLFPHSEYVVELLPSHWTKVGNDTRAKYVIQTNPTNTSEEYDKIDIDSVQVWLLFLYSPRCSMSRIVVSMLELAAQHLDAENIRVGAYGCGIYGDSLQQSKRRGFAAWDSDPICKQFQRKETPNTHVIVEAIGGNQVFKDRAASFSIFYSAAARGTIKDLWPRKFIDFAVTGKEAWEDSALVERLTADNFESPSFHNTSKVIVFINEMEDNKSHEVQQGLLAALPSLARRLKEANITVGVASCGSDSDDDPRLIDCSMQNVSWLPDIKMFGVNQTEGYSLISDQFIEMRDVHIALEAMANTVAALFGLDYDDKSNLEEEKIDEEEQGSTCSNQAEDQNFEELEENNVEKLDVPEREQDQNFEKLEEDNVEKLDSSEKPKLESAGNIKLSAQQNTWHLPNRSKRKRVGSPGGGIVHGISSQGGVGAIAG